MSVVSCSFKSKDGSTKSESKKRSVTNAELKKLDSDGDLVNDFQEIETGLDPLISDLPKLRIRFLQDFNIGITYEDESYFSIDTSINRDNPDFKYRVGTLYVFDNALDNAARLGKYSGVSWGHIKNEDLNLVKFPFVDKKLVHTKLLEYEKHKEKKVKELTVTFNNVVKLENDGVFSQIENLELNFYYFNKKESKWSLLYSHKEKEALLSGVSENIEVKIHNPPIELIEENFLRSGEFIVSEVKDFYIPKLKTTYKKLLASVKEKTIPVYRYSPLDKEVRYVALKVDGDSFDSILNKLYPDKFIIKNEKLDKLEQFSTSLPSFKFLHEVRDENKLGRWFVMTNKIKKHYLKHEYKKGDKIVLSYVTGSELASRVESEVFSKYDYIKSGIDKVSVKLGQITKNSEIEFLIKPESEYGTKLDIEQGTFRFAPPNCRNCTGTNWGVFARFDINKFSNFSSPMKDFPINYLYESFNIYLNNQVLDLEKLLSTGDLILDIVPLGSKNLLVVKLKNLHQFDSIRIGEENIAYLKLKSRNKATESEGLKLTHMEGKNVDLDHHGGHIAFTQAGQRKIPIATTSWHFNKWQSKVFWGRKMPDGYVPTKGATKTHYRGLSLSVVTTITNFLN